MSRMGQIITAFDLVNTATTRPEGHNLTDYHD